MEEIVQFESMIEDLLVNQFAICDDFIDESLLALLLAEMQVLKGLGALKEAGVGRSKEMIRETEIRGDFIKWIEPSSSNPAELLFLSKVSRFQAYLNRTCYTSLNDFECHFAEYPAGSFYKKHLDRFKSNSERHFSLIVYLNENWLIQDGGQLVVYPEGKEMVSVLPLAKRAVFFRSDVLLHEVLPSSSKSRRSITGWMKRVDLLEMVI